MERELAVSAGAYYSGSALDATRFSFYGAPKAGVTLQQLEQGIDEVIDEVLAKGVTPEETERAKNRLIADAVFAQDSIRASRDLTLDVGLRYDRQTLTDATGDIFAIEFAPMRPDISTSPVRICTMPQQWFGPPSTW